MTELEVVCLVVVVVLGAVFFAARLVVGRRQVDALMRQSLQSNDAQVRMAAISLLGRSGAVGKYTGVLLWRVRVESDPLVHQELASLAASDSWSGTPSTQRTEFHLWGVAETLRRTHPAHIEAKTQEVP